MKNKKLKSVLIVFIVILILVLCFNMGVYAAYIQYNHWQKRFQ